MNVSRRVTTIVTIMLALLGSAFWCLELRQNAIDDFFHEGEYFAYFLSISKGIADGYPLSLHGALDYFPAAIAYRLAGSDTYFFWTLTIHALFNVATIAVYAMLAASLLRNSPNRFPLLPAAVLFGPAMLSLKELFTILGALLFVEVLRLRASTGTRRITAEIALGMVMAIGLFWSFDRGLAQLSAVGLPAFLLMIRERTFRLTLVAWIVTLATLDLASPVFSLAAYVENLRVISHVSSQFSYGVQREAWLYSLAGTAITVSSMAMMGLTARVARSDTTRLTALMLALLSAAVLKMVSYRADLSHFTSMLWAPALALLFAAEQLRGTRYQRLFVATLGSIALVAVALIASIGLEPRWIIVFLLAFVGLLLAAQHGVPATRSRLVAASVAIAIPTVTLAALVGAGGREGDFAWMSRIAAPPNNAALVSSGMNEVVDALRGARLPCLLDLANHGVINGMLDVPACSRFTYPVYATPIYEDELLRSVAKQSIDAVVYSSTSWAYRIDGVAMSTRFPRLDAYLLSEFPVQTCTKEYCLRTRR